MYDEFLIHKAIDNFAIINYKTFCIFEKKIKE